MLQGGLVMAESRKRELGDNICKYYKSIFNRGKTAVDRSAHPKFNSGSDILLSFETTESKFESS